MFCPIWTSKGFCVIFKCEKGFFAPIRDMPPFSSDLMLKCVNKSNGNLPKHQLSQTVKWAKFDKTRKRSNMYVGKKTNSGPERRTFRFFGFPTTNSSLANIAFYRATPGMDRINAPTCSSRDRPGARQYSWSKISPQMHAVSPQNRGSTVQLALQLYMVLCTKLALKWN